MSGTKKKNNICLQVSQWFMSCLDKYEQSIFLHTLNFLKNITIIPQRGMSV